MPYWYEYTEGEARKKLEQWLKRKKYQTVEVCIPKVDSSEWKEYMHLVDELCSTFNPDLFMENEDEYLLIETKRSFPSLVLTAFHQLDRYATLAYVLFPKLKDGTKQLRKIIFTERDIRDCSNTRRKEEALLMLTNRNDIEYWVWRDLENRIA